MRTFWNLILVEEFVPFMELGNNLYPKIDSNFGNLHRVECSRSSSEQVLGFLPTGCVILGKWSLLPTTCLVQP